LSPTAHLKFEGGYISPLFVTDGTSRVVDLSEPYILVYDKQLPTMREMMPFLDWAVQSGKPLVFIGADPGLGLLHLLVENTERGSLPAAAVRVQGSDEYRKEILEKIATITGGLVFNDDLGLDFRQFVHRGVGTAKRIVIGKDRTVVYPVKGEGAGHTEFEPVSGTALANHAPNSDAAAKTVAAEGQPGPPSSGSRVVRSTQQRMAIANKPGAGGQKLSEATAAMISAVKDGRVTLETFRRMKQKELGEFYPGARRTTLAQARENALVVLMKPMGFDKAPT
jgi:hypothetical protein